MINIQQLQPPINFWETDSCQELLVIERKIVQRMKVVKSIQFA
jgi:hypothetical protein